MVEKKLTPKEIKQKFVQIEILKERMKQSEEEIMQIIKELDLKPGRAIKKQVRYKTKIERLRRIFSKYPVDTNNIVLLICGEVEKVKGCNYDQQKQKCRKRKIVLSRQLAITLISEFTALSLKEIASYFTPAIKDHTTVMYSIDTIQDLCDTDEQLKEEVRKLRERIPVMLRALSRKQPQLQAA